MQTITNLRSLTRSEYESDYKPITLTEMAAYRRNEIDDYEDAELNCRWAYIQESTTKLLNEGAIGSFFGMIFKVLKSILNFFVAIIKKVGEMFKKIIDFFTGGSSGGGGGGGSSSSGGSSGGSNKAGGDSYTKPNDKEEKHIENLEKNLEDLNKQKEKLEEQIEEKQEEVDKASKQTEEFISRVKAKQEKKKNASTPQQKDAIQKEIDDIVEEKTKFEKRLEESRKELSELKAENSKVRHDLNKFNVSKKSFNDGNKNGSGKDGDYYRSDAPYECEYYYVPPLYNIQSISKRIHYDEGLVLVSHDTTSYEIAGTLILDTIENDEEDRLVDSKYERMLRRAEKELEKELEVAKTVKESKMSKDDVIKELNVHTDNNGMKICDGIELKHIKEQQMDAFKIVRKDCETMFGKYTGVLDKDARFNEINKRIQNLKDILEKELKQHNSVADCVNTYAFRAYQLTNDGKAATGKKYTELSDKEKQEFKDKRTAQVENDKYLNKAIAIVKKSLTNSVNIAKDLASSIGAYTSVVIGIVTNIAKHNRTVMAKIKADLGIGSENANRAKNSESLYPIRDSDREGKEEYSRYTRYHKPNGFKTTGVGSMNTKRIHDNRTRGEVDADRKRAPTSLSDLKGIAKGKPKDDKAFDKLPDSYRAKYDEMKRKKDEEKKKK